MSLLQEQLNELGSTIIDVQNDYIKLTGFMCPERLLDYIVTGDDCRYSVGIYPTGEYNIAFIKDNSLCIIQENGIETNRYNFKPIKTDTVKYKIPNEKSPRSKVYTIRQCTVTYLYNYKDMDESLLFDTNLELETYFSERYRIELEL